MIIKNNTAVVTEDKNAICDAMDNLISHSVTYAATTDLTAKEEARGAMEEEKSIITDYKNILERELKNISELDKKLTEADNSIK